MQEILLEKVMTKSVITLAQDDNMLYARELFRKHRVHHLPVVDRDSRKIIGIISNADLEASKEGFTLFKIRNREEHNRDILEMTAVAFVMKRDVKCLSPLDTIREAYLVFKQNDFRCVPIVDGEQLVGIVTPLDLLDYFFEEKTV